MRIVTGLTLAMLLAGCSARAPSDDAGPAEGPGTGITVRAGIALQYAYRYQLPAAGIAAAQERHAAACERLGPDRCRITALQYRVDGPHRIAATLDVALAPAIARAYGRAATAAIVAAQGRLVETEIGSTDAGTAAADAVRQRSEATTRLTELNRRLADPRVRAEERTIIATEASALRERIDTASATVGTAATALAATPMHIVYDAGDLVRGFDRAAPLRDAFGSALDRLIAGLALLVTLIVTLLPWAAAVALGLWLWRRYLRRWFPNPDDPTA